MENEGLKVTVSRGGIYPQKDLIAENRDHGEPQQALSSQKHNSSVQKERWIVSVIDGLLSATITLLFFGLPLFFTTRTFQGIVFEKMFFFYVAVLIMLVLWATRGVICGELKIRKTPLDIPILIMAVAYGLSGTFSVDRWHSFWGFFGDPSRGIMTMLALVVAYYILASNFTEKRLWYAMHALVLSNALLAVWMFLALLGVHVFPDSIAARLPLSPFGSLSALSVFLGMMIPIVMMSVFRVAANGFKSPMLRTFVAGMIALVAIANVLLLWFLYAFVPWIAVLIGVSFFLIYVLAQIVRPARSWAWLPGLVFIAVLAILLMGKSSLVRVQLPIEATPNFALSWKITKEALGQHLVIGSGPATFGYDFSRFKPQEFNLNPLYNLRFYQGTGLLFEFFVTTGIVGSIAAVLLVLSFISVVIYLLSRQTQLNKLNSLGLVAAAIIFLFAALTSQTEGVVLTLGVLIATLALATINFESRSEEKFVHLSLKASPKYALALAFVFMVVSAGVVFLFVYLGKAFVADVYAGQAVRTQTITEDGSIAQMSKAIGLFGREGRYYTRLAQDYMVLANNEFMKDEQSRDAEALKRYLTNSIVAAKSGIGLMPNDVLSQEVLAQVYENAAFYIPQSAALAQESYQRALELEPHNAQYMVKLGQIKEADVSAKQGEEQKQLLREAQELFEKAIAEKKDYAPAYYQLALTKEALGDLDGAIIEINSAVSLDGTNANAVYNLGRLYQRRGGTEDLKIAQQVYQKILEANNKDVNTHLSLGLLYEKTNKISDAITEYQAVLDALPENAGDDVRQKVQKMISNAQNGIGNTPQTIEETNENQ